MLLSYASCAVSHLPLRKEPSHRAEQISQMLFGERAEILKLQDDYWAYIRCFNDDYEGWCLLGQLRILSKKDFIKDPKFLSLNIGNKLITLDTEIILPLGACIAKGTLMLDSEKAKFKGKKLLPPNAADTETTKLLYYAKSYLHAPYLWGGRSHDGIDCSGLSQMVFLLFGIKIKRDASQQAQQGETVNFLQEARCGDLAFFANSDGRINHVGILLDEHHIIHSTETAGCVVIDKIDQEGIVSKQLRKRTHSLRLIKRYF